MKSTWNLRLKSLLQRTQLPAELDAVDPEPEIEEPVVEDAVIPNPTARDEADEIDDQTAEERRSEELQRKVSANDLSL